MYHVSTYVASINDDSPALLSSIKPGDEILKINSQVIFGSDVGVVKFVTDLQNYRICGILSLGRSFLLKVVHQNTEYESKIELKPKFCFYSRVQKNATLLGSLINFVVTFGVNNTSIYMSYIV